LATIILGFVVTVLTIAIGGLYRDLGNMARQHDIESRWPFSNLSVGQQLTFELGSTPDFSGFVVLCSDDVDALGAVFSVTTIAQEWALPLVIAIVDTGRPTGWTSRLPQVAGALTVVDDALGRIRELRPARLPVCAYLREGRVLDASLALESPSIVASRFEHVAAPLNVESRSFSW
jgi:hypothetical protein